MSNTINYRYSKTFGGMREVFNTEGGAFHPVRHGGKLNYSHAPATGETLYAGDFGYLNELTGVVSWLRVFEVAEAIDDAATTLKIYQRDFDHVLREGDVIMVAPATPSTTGAAITVGTITYATVDGENVATFTIVADSLGELDANTLMVIGASAGSGKLPAIPNINVIFAENVTPSVSYKTSAFQSGKADIVTNLYYHACIDRDCVKIPAYVESLNKLSNSVLFFEL